MLKTLYAKLLAVLVGLTVIMAVMFLIVIRHSDVARNQEINQKVYGNLASRLIHEEILAERDRADPSAVQQVFDRIRVVNPRIDVYLLDRFYRVEKSRGLAAGNAGLGLAITKRILDLHGSTISVSSEPGRTVFRFTLAYAPLAGPADSRASQIEPAAARRVPSLAYPMADPSG